MSDYIRTPTGREIPLWLKGFAREIERFIAGVSGFFTSTGAATASISVTSHSTFVDASAGPVTAALPAAASAKGQTFIVKKIDGSANAVTLDPAGSETIDGAATKVLTGQWDAYSIISSGTGWYIV